MLSSSKPAAHILYCSHSPYNKTLTKEGGLYGMEWEHGCLTADRVLNSGQFMDLRKNLVIVPLH